MTEYKNRLENFQGFFRDQRERSKPPSSILHSSEHITTPGVRKFWLWEHSTLPASHLLVGQCASPSPIDRMFHEGRGCIYLVHWNLWHHAWHLVCCHKCLLNPWINYFIQWFTHSCVENLDLKLQRLPALISISQMHWVFLNKS